MSNSIVVIGTAVVTSVLGACQPRIFPDTAGANAPIYGDSVQHVTIAVGQHAQLIDSAGRARGALPSRLEEVLPTRWLRDIWGNPLAYSTRGTDFTLRSAGRDGIAGNNDDIFAHGRLGRAVPCELRAPGYVTRFEVQAPLCEETPLLVLERCPSAEFLPEVLGENPQLARRDPARATGERLARIARRIDGTGRALGALPHAASAFWQNQAAVDAWGRRLVYRPAGRRFELRSAGADGVPDTVDDVHVHAELGGVIRCEFIHAGQANRCAEFLPQCPGADGPSGREVCSASDSDTESGNTAAAVIS